MDTKKYFLPILFVFLLVGTFLTASYLEKTKYTEEIKHIETIHQNTIQEKDNTINDLSLCLRNQARSLETYTQPYNFETFGIYSPNLESTTVSVSEYAFCGDVVKIHKIELDATTVYVRYIESPGEFSQTFVFDLLTPDGINPPLYVARDIPSFEYYENYSLAAFKLSDISKKWSLNDSYTTEKGMTFFYDTYYSARSLSAVTAHSHSHTSPLGGEIHVEIRQKVDPLQVLQGKYDPVVLETRKQLTEFLDTVDIKY